MGAEAFDFTATETSSTDSQALKKVKTLVYKQRINLKDFFTDYDKLRTGLVHENQFLMALNAAGINKHISPALLQQLAEEYRAWDTEVKHKPDVPSTYKCNYRQFCEDVDKVFTRKNLEKDPGAYVPEEPTELLDRHRYQRCAKTLDEAKEARLAELLARMSRQCRVEGIQVKPFFDDASNDKNSSHLVNHVTINQFKQGLSVNLGFNVSSKDTDLLVEKFGNEDYPDMVNYAVFTNIVQGQQAAA
ncbi:hypothetical protein WJX73_003195 [Symbiochloris irregularis]|uniref:EF-hand domain-containing protein n=1 Tax=Symbiochloris irregularis TaxID=706552 RepID=A0AAW1PW36_9CHLO